MPEPDELKVKTLGEPAIPSPLPLSMVHNDDIADFVPDDARVLATIETRAGEAVEANGAFEKAGPRSQLYFDPGQTRVGIVTCGGLCPGLNNVIRALVLELHHHYKVREVLGYRYGFEGLNRERGVKPISLGLSDVTDIHKHGGSLLGVSRGAEDPGVIVNTLEAHDVQILFCIGGDGTLKGAHSIHQEIERRGVNIGVVGIPKTIDNDIACVDKTFGFDTAVEMARLAIDGAHTEAQSARNGIGLVKVMGRDVGFIAAVATLASLDVNFCLIPEVAFDLEGPNGLLLTLERRLRSRRHAVIVVAEGCGSSMADEGVERDASGNIRFGSHDLDIGLYLERRVKDYLKAIELPSTLKYIDPSYMIRSVPANANDSIFCDILGRHAVHAALAGKTDLVIGRAYNIFTHVPLTLSTTSTKRVDPEGALWRAVIETTGQPALTNPRKPCEAKT
jgi:6-phosphofructokinase 1